MQSFQKNAPTENTDDVVLICSQHLQEGVNQSETDQLKNCWNDWRSYLKIRSYLTFDEKLKDLILCKHK